MATNEKQNNPSLSLDQALNHIDAFLQKYLVCSIHHRTILALWVVHTYCFERFPVTPYLEICSPEAQSGKSTCLGLLRVLSKNSWMPGGVTAACLTTRLASNQPTLLLDDWHTVLRPSGTQPLLALLKAGSRSGSYYPEYPKERDWDGKVFCPKAFAGQGRLPAALSALCIPIVLRRKKAKERINSFWHDRTQWEVYDFRKSLSVWGEENSEAIRDLAVQNLANTHIASAPGLRRDALISLLTLALAAGRNWEYKLRLALSRIFAAQQAHTSSTGLQLLSGIRDFFTLQNDPPKIHTAPLLEYLNGLEERPWKNLTPNKLRVILQDYPIHRSANQRIGDQQFKGFTFQHFVESWESYLPHLASRRLPCPISAAGQVVVNEASAVPNGLGSVPNEGGTVPDGGRSVPDSAQNVPNLPSETNNPNALNTPVSDM
ncbi:MAG TPA: DUF3631 domain-containing protein [Candidatus Angelobacter sp.]|jgi:hypothetical protein|nr:DUF3631 domain-containing protein [Candidatus Angelobacter sp.]